MHVRNASRLTVPFPQKFSLIDNPVEFLAFLKSYRSQISKPYVRVLHFDCSKCESIGLDAQAIVDAFLQEEMRRRKDQDYIVGGAFPQDVRLKTMLKAIGTLRMLNHPEMHLPDGIEARIERCDMLYGNGKRIKASAARDRAGTGLVNYFGRVLAHQGFDLTYEGRAFLTSLLTEVIGNAEEHSGRWYAIGYSYPTVTEREADELEECQIVMFNFGKTIHESLSARSASASVKERVESLIEHHRRSNHFNERWKEECLWTVCALQQGVSRYKEGERGITRGNGTVEMIRAFSALAGDPQKMCLVSGNTYILFDGTYELSKRSSGVSQIAFNESNDLKVAPDPEHVFWMPERFPGTVISLRFSISASQLQERQNGK